MKTLDASRIRPYISNMESEKTIEQQICLQIINMNLKEAQRLISQNDLVFHVLENDGKYFMRSDPCFISHRINLIVRRGRVVGTEVG